MTSESTSSDSLPGKEIPRDECERVDIEIELRLRVEFPVHHVERASEFDCMKAQVWARAKRATEGMAGTLLALHLKNKMGLPGNVTVDAEDVDLGPEAYARWKRMMDEGTRAENKEIARED